MFIGALTEPYHQINGKWVPMDSSEPASSSDSAPIPAEPPTPAPSFDLSGPEIRNQIHQLWSQVQFLASPFIQSGLLNELREDHKVAKAIMLKATEQLKTLEAVP
jgi:hypothetical protein